MIWFFKLIVSIWKFFNFPYQVIKSATKQGLNEDDTAKILKALEGKDDTDDRDD